MFIVKFVPPSFMRDVKPIAFVASDIDTAKKSIAEKLNQELSFEPGVSEIKNFVKNGEEYMDLVYDKTGSFWQARNAKNGHVTIKPIEFIQ